VSPIRTGSLVFLTSTRPKEDLQCVGHFNLWLPRPENGDERREIAMESLWLLVVAGGPAIILVVVVLVLMQRRRRYQPDARSPDYEVGGNKYVRDPADKTRST
jgi:hypothetical protein